MHTHKELTDGQVQYPISPPVLNPGAWPADGESEGGKPGTRAGRQEQTRTSLGEWTARQTEGAEGAGSLRSGHRAPVSSAARHPQRHASPPPAPHVRTLPGPRGLNERIQAHSWVTFASYPTLSEPVSSSQNEDRRAPTLVGG